MTEETFKRKFRSSKPEAAESFVQFVTRLRSYFRRWIDMSGIDKTYDRLFDFMVCDQFLFMCNLDLKTFLLEKRCESAEALASMADMYRGACMVSAVSLSSQNKKQTRNKTDNKSVASGSSSGQQSGQSRQGDNRTGFNCNKAGHIATKCPNNENTGRKCYICNKTTHITRDCPQRNRVTGIIEQDTQEDDEELHEGMSTCGACTIVTETLTDARASMPTCVKEPIMAHLASGVQSLMPVLQGKMVGKVVDVLRDTGCSGVVVRKRLKVCCNKDLLNRQSPYSSPIVLIKKKNGSNRFCINMRALNNITVFDAEPIPNTEDIFTKLAGCKYFSKLDLSKGYWQVPLEKESKAKTAFQTPLGLIEFSVMPFGLVTAPATFTRMMRILLEKVSNTVNLIDDIIVFTKTFSEHMDSLKRLLSHLRDACLTAKPSKCTIACHEIECLGYIVGVSGMSPNPDKVQAIQTAERPTTKGQVRSFLGLVGFYRRYIPNFSLIALPLTDITRKGQPNHIKWRDAQEKAFRTLKQVLLKEPILKLPNCAESFILQTDASEFGLGAILLQRKGEVKLSVAYDSRKLKVVS